MCSCHPLTRDEFSPARRVGPAIRRSASGHTVLINANVVQNTQRAFLRDLPSCLGTSRSDFNQPQCNARKTPVDRFHHSMSGALADFRVWLPTQLPEQVYPFFDYPGGLARSNDLNMRTRPPG